MDVREKLVELLDRFVYDEWYGNGDIAEKLISNGVTVQELDGCKYCKEYEDLPEHFIDGKYVGRVFDTCIQTNENGFLLAMQTTYPPASGSLSLTEIHCGTVTPRSTKYCAIAKASSP